MSRPGCSIPFPGPAGPGAVLRLPAGGGSAARARGAARGAPGRLCPAQLLPHRPAPLRRPGHAPAQLQLRAGPRGERGPGTPRHPRPRVPRPCPMCRSPQGEDALVRLLSVLCNVANQLYYPCEHLAWAADVGIVRAGSQKWWTRSTALWGCALLLSILRYGMGTGHSKAVRGALPH